MSLNARDDGFCEKMVQLGLYSNPVNLERHLQSFFGTTPCEGASVLDIGGGDGLLSLAAIHRGARQAILLEPEEDGSTAGMNARFRKAAEVLGFTDRVELRVQTFQQFEPGESKFDLVLSHNSINHLEEEACVDLRRSRDARNVYLELLDKLRRMLSPGATMIVCDASSRNLFGDLGSESPFARTIEWQKHQPPWFWAELFEEAGFERKSIGWMTFNSLGSLGSIFRNRLAAYLTFSEFRLVVGTPTGSSR